LIAFVFMLASCASPPRMEAPASFEADKTLQRPQNDRMVAYSVSLTLFVVDTDEARRIILEQIRNSNGFIVRETGNDISTRIPSENLDNFLNNIRVLGEIENESRTGTDITDQYRDDVIRLDSLKSVRDRYLVLLERANGISDVLSIERELERVILEIERLEGRIRHAELSVSYSIASIRFTSERSRPGPIGWIFYGLFRGIKWLFVWN